MKSTQIKKQIQRTKNNKLPFPIAQVREYLREIVNDITFNSSEHYPYKPKLVTLLSDSDAQYTMEYHNNNQSVWLRILRIKNNRRTHDFIINDFKDNKIVIENENSQYCELKFSDIKLLQELFATIEVHPKYNRKRSSPADKYVVVGKPISIKSVLSVCSLIPCAVLIIS